MKLPLTRFYNFKRFETVNEDTTKFATECTSISFDNRGQVAVSLYAEGTVLEILPGEAISHNNAPEVTETTFYEKVVFAPGAGIKRLFVTREYVVPERPEHLYQDPDRY